MQNPKDAGHSMIMMMMMMSIANTNYGCKSGYVNTAIILIDQKRRRINHKPNASKWLTAPQKPAKVL